MIWHSQNHSLADFMLGEVTIEQEFDVQNSMRFNHLVTLHYFRWMFPAQQLDDYSVYLCAHEVNRMVDCLDILMDEVTQEAS